MTEPAARAWPPLVEGSEAEAWRASIRLEAQALVVPLESSAQPVDTAGWCWLGRALDEPALTEQGGAWLERHLDRLDAVEAMGMSLYGGLAEIALAVTLIDPAAPGEASLCDDLDAALSDGMCTVDAQGNVDLLHGVAGVGWYAAQRVGHASAQDLAAACHQWLARNAHRAPHQQGGVIWRRHREHAGPIAATQAGAAWWVDLGLSHGLAGPIAFLAAEAQAWPETDPTLLRDAVAGLRGFALTTSLARFGYDDRGDEPARLAWCYGDLGIALALDAAGMALADEEIRRFAVQLALGAAARPFDGSGVRDGALCHGAAGVAHAFHHFFWRTGDVRFADAARSWLARIGALPTCWKEEPVENDHDRHGFLVGRLGIVLVRLTAANGGRPWFNAYLGMSSPMEKTAP